MMKEANGVTKCTSSKVRARLFLLLAISTSGGSIGGRTLAGGAPSTGGGRLDGLKKF